MAMSAVAFFGKLGRQARIAHVQRACPLARLASCRAHSVSAAEQPPTPDRGVLPEHLQRIVDEYDQQRAEEEKSKLWIRRVFGERYAGVIGMGLAGCICYVLYCFDDVSSEVHYVSGLLLRHVDPARARRLLVTAGAWHCLPHDYDKDDPYLMIEPREGLRFATPVGLDAGFDVEARAVNAFIDMGFGFVEVGPVGGTGFSDVDIVRKRLLSRNTTSQLAHLGVVGVALCGDRNDLLRFVPALGPHCDYLSIDVSALPASSQAGESLQRLVAEIVDAAALLHPVPKIFLRMPAEDSSGGADSLKRSHAAAAAAVAGFAGGADGIILGSSIEVISEAYRQTHGEFVIIAHGGLSSGLDVFDCIEAGASVVQISSALLSDGPAACRRIKNDLSQMLMNEGYGALQDAVGVHHRKRGTRRKNPWKQRKISEAIR